MVRASIRVDLSGILRRLDPLGRIYGWIPSGDLLGSVTRVPYLEELLIERNTEKLNLARIALKHLQTTYKWKLYTQQEKVSRFYYFSPYFELFRRIDGHGCISHTNSYNNAIITQCHVDGHQRAWATCGNIGQLVRIWI